MQAIFSNLLAIHHLKFHSKAQSESYGAVDVYVV